MRPAKKFDCVQMKWDIQQKLTKDFAHLSPVDARAALRARIEQDAELSAFLERVREIKGIQTTAR